LLYCSYDLIENQFCVFLQRCKDIQKIDLNQMAIIFLRKKLRKRLRRNKCHHTTQLVLFYHYDTYIIKKI